MTEIQQSRNQESENIVEQQLRSEIRTLMSEHPIAQQDMQEMLSQSQGDFASCLRNGPLGQSIKCDNLQSCLHDWESVLIRLAQIPEQDIMTTLFYSQI